LQILSLLEPALRTFGKGPGFLALAFFEVAAGFIIAYYKPDALAGLATVLGAVNVPVYGGGAWKAAAEAKANGNAKAA